MAMLEVSSQPDQSLYKVKHSDELGRYLVASQDIEARTLIISEKPLVCGPADDETDEESSRCPMCLGCFRRITTKVWNRCSKCSWPVCDHECEIAEHHAANECQVFVRNSVKYPCRHTWPVVNKSILVLRTLLLKNKSPSLWQKVILKLEHHTYIRQTKTYCSNADADVLDNLNEFLLGCTSDENEEIIRVSGIINVNAFSSTKSAFHGTGVRMFQCIYQEASLLNHSCIPNAIWSIKDSNQFSMSVRSTVNIRKGERINIAYNNPAMTYGTLNRIIAIEDVAHFMCKCARCSSCTESGTYTQAIKCFNCEVNYLLPEIPTDPDSRWQCCGCGSFQSVQSVVLFLDCIEESYERIKKGFRSRSQSKQIEKMDLFVRQHEGILHKNHYILQDIRMKIISLQLYALGTLTEDSLERFIDHCKIMLSIADTLMPGFSQSRGLLRKASIKETCTTTPEGRKEIVKLYKEIHCLQTRSLLYFNCQHSLNEGQTSEANQFATHIQRQLKTVEKFEFIDT